MKPFTSHVTMMDTHNLTDIVAQCHVAGDVNTGGLLVPGQQAPVSKVTQGGRHQASKQQHQHLHPKTSSQKSETSYKPCLFLLMALNCVRKYFLLLHIHFVSPIRQPPHTIDQFVPGDCLLAMLLGNPLVATSAMLRHRLMIAPSLGMCVLVATRHSLYTDNTVLTLAGR